MWYLLKAVLLWTVFPPLKNVCFPALWFSHCRERNPEAPVKTEFLLSGRRTSSQLLQHHDTHVHHVKSSRDQLMSDWHLHVTHQSIHFMTVISSTERTHLAPFFCFRISYWKRYLVNFMFVLQQNSYALLRSPRADKPLWKCSYITTSSLTKQFKVWWDTSVTAPRRKKLINLVGTDNHVKSGFHFYFPSARPSQAGGREQHCITVTLFVFFFNFSFLFSVFFLGLCKREAGRQMNTNSQRSVSNISAASFTNCLRHLWGTGWTANCSCLLPCLDSVKSLFTLAQGRSNKFWTL